MVKILLPLLIYKKIFVLTSIWRVQEKIQIERTACVGHVSEANGNKQSCLQDIGCYAKQVPQKNETAYCESRSTSLI